MESCIWISNDIFDWDFEQTGGTALQDTYRQRAYDIWNHSRLIESSTNEFDYADGITNLKRYLNQRLKAIESIYSLKKIHFSGMPRGYLEILQSYSLVRPFW